MRCLADEAAERASDSNCSLDVEPVKSFRTEDWGLGIWLRKQRLFKPVDDG